MDSKKIGRKIKNARIESGLSQAQLGKELGVTWEMVSRYENGRSSAFNHIDTIADILRKDVGYFLGFSHQVKYDTKEEQSGNTKGGNLRTTIPLFDSYNEVIDEEYEPTLHYDIPGWVVTKYTKLFALRLVSFNPEESDMEFSREDVAVLSKVTYNLESSYVLTLGDDDTLRLKKFESTDNVLGKLLYIERRFC
ncbi:helix-turn-helix transcriptional regulator [Candidatus Dojkabacteria bacterium]|uniref:Helix-turn-helix transcriptional regulator n=1 Tax=Candidatus Dojkabacteria bacterium TaxID=2099670 RepID=A0A955L8B4_9BACT|nr:helix-turn-helix transcriptional regulator [Candidatus Dojkabacteria bacterium]